MKKGPRCGLIGTLAAGLLLVASLGAQTRKPLIELNSLNAEGLGEEETRLLGHLIRSYLSDFGEVTGYFNDSLQGASRAAGSRFIDPPRASGMASGQAPDYILSGSVYLERDKIKFILEIHNTRTQDTSVLTMESQSMGEMVLRARSLVETAFSAERGSPRPEEAGFSRPSGDMVMGTWRGEQGIEMIRLYDSGQGIAFFSSGVRMALFWDLSGGVLRVEQRSPNTEQFYSHLPSRLAAHLAERAEPLRWELRLHGSGNVLRGERIFTAPGDVSREGDPELLFGQREMVMWTRSVH
jgi:hypothetical protein